MPGSGSPENQRTHPDDQRLINACRRKLRPGRRINAIIPNNRTATGCGPIVGMPYLARIFELVRPVTATSHQGVSGISQLDVKTVARPIRFGDIAGHLPSVGSGSDRA